MGLSGDQVFRGLAGLPVAVPTPIELVREIEPARPRKVVLCAASATTMILARAHLIQAFAAHGFEVVCAAQGGAEIATAFAQLGARYVEPPRSGFRAQRWLAQERPDAIVSLDGRADRALMRAAAAARVPRRVAVIEELGAAYAQARGWRASLARLSADRRHRADLALADTVIAANEDDRALIAGRFMRGARARVVNAPGIGIELDAFRCEKLPEGRLTFVMPGPLLAAKGVFEFAEAARRLKARELDVRFILVGAFAEGPGAVARETVEAWVDDGRLEHVEDGVDARGWIREAHVVVLPSYREGVARLAMTAMAMGRPVIAGDVAGLREVVAHHKTGILVAPQSAAALDEALTLIVRTPALIAPMARAARWTAESEFDAGLKAAEMVRQLAALL